ncbi:hypothetical protein AVEN_243851-1 [Araneus ventricosus]|uniref:Uncharacterized protein n=1 Tax=Araneus ventricosus TaxID=182803 RepID=A0A4Y2A5R7_ARAVE|nr:hypothetical protein AVEN_243851-1 [Araneus ventricosus]
MTRTTPELVPLSNLHIIRGGGRLAITYGLTCNRPQRGNLQWNRVSRLEPSSPEAKTLPVGHCGPKNIKIDTCLAHIKSEVVGQMSSRWCRAVVWRGGRRPSYLTASQNYVPK